MEKGNFLTLRDMYIPDFKCNEEVLLKNYDRYSLATISTQNKENKLGIVKKINEYVNSLGDHIRDWNLGLTNEPKEKNIFLLDEGIVAYENSEVTGWDSQIQRLDMSFVALFILN